MFFVAPLGNGLAWCRAPWGTVLLLCANILVAAWVLPASERLRWERLQVEREGVVAVAGPISPGLERARREVRAARLAEVATEDPFECYGYRRGARPGRALTALFVHADPLHLCANLLFLAFLGAWLEQAWGVAGPVLLYVGAGAAALAADAHFGSPGLVVGGSGGVAAILGAYCVVFRRRPLRLGYAHLVYLRPHFGTVALPVWVLGIVWTVQQAVGFALAQRSGETGIAFVSHLAGFALGCAAAWLVAARTRPSLEAPQLP